MYRIRAQSQKIIVLIAKDGFVAVLEEMAGAAVATIKIQGVPGEEFSHDRGDARLAALEKDVNMIVHKDPGIDCALPLRDGPAESFEEPGFVLIVSKDVRLVDPSYHDVVQSTWNIQSCLAWHGAILSKALCIVKLKALYEPTSPNAPPVICHEASFEALSLLEHGSAPFLRPLTVSVRWITF